MEMTARYSVKMKPRTSLSILLLLALSLYACAIFSRTARRTQEPEKPKTNTPVENIAIRVTPIEESTRNTTPIEEKTRYVTYIAGSTRKICQLTGDTDHQLSQPTLNQTRTRYGVFGTDLGASFAHDGFLYFLFGDTVGLHGGDSIAFTQDVQPEDCLSLQFVAGADGRYLPPSVPGVSLDAFEVPTGGFSANGHMYVFFTTGHTEQRVMGRSVLARSDDGAQSFVHLYDVSKEKFINISPVVIDNAAIDGLPESDGQGLLAWGSGTYRRSNPYLAYISLDSVEDRSAWRFFTGVDSITGLPRWSASETEAAALFDHPCLGEFSVAWYSSLGKWLMFYNCALPRGVIMRSADQPWGPWSDREIIFQPWDDGGYCQFMHVSYQDRNCDTVQDPGRDNEWAGEYGPYMIPSLASVHDGTTTVYFVLSTWNPYAVMLMKTDISIE